jgi:hypothetical protein
MGVSMFTYGCESYVSSKLCTTKIWVTVLALLIHANFSKNSQLVVHGCGTPFVLDDFIF